jgi:AraC-like DNA-binding protein
MREKGITKRYTFQKLAPGDFPLIVRSHNQCDHVMHSHDFIELVIIQSGKGEHLTKNESQHVSMGDVIVIPKGVRHGYDCVENMKIVNVIFDESLLDTIHGDIRKLSGFHALFFTAHKSHNTQHPVKYEISALSPDEISHLEKIAGRIKSELAEKRPGYRSLCSALMIELVVFLSRKEFKQNSFSDKNSLDKALAYIEQNYSKKIELATLAKIGGYSPRTFQRIFRKAAGQTPFEHILSVRLRHSRQLLINPSKRISEIAAQTGFTDSAYFAKQFKKLFEISPKTYRERNAR